MFQRIEIAHSGLLTTSSLTNFFLRLEKINLMHASYFWTLSLHPWEIFLHWSLCVGQSAAWHSFEQYCTTIQLEHTSTFFFSFQLGQMRLQQGEALGQIFSQISQTESKQLHGIRFRRKCRASLTLCRSWILRREKSSDPFFLSFVLTQTTEYAPLSWQWEVVYHDDSFRLWLSRDLRLCRSNESATASS